MRGSTTVKDAITIAVIAGCLVAYALWCTPNPEPIPVDTGAENTPTSTSTPLVFSTPVLTPTPEPTSAALATPRRSNPVSATSTPVEGGTFASLPLPANVTIRFDGCSVSYGCQWGFNYYDAGSREVVLQGPSPDRMRVHEYCHAHQHWTINGGQDLAPAEYDLSPWYATAQAQSYQQAAIGWPYPYGVSTANTLLEDFAEACGLWYTDPARLLALSPDRYEWMRGNLP